MASHDVAESERYLRFLVRAGELLARSLDTQDTLRNVCAAAVGSIADLCIVYLGGAGSAELAAAAHCDPDRTRNISDAGRFLRSEPGYPVHPVCRVISEGQPFAAARIDDAWIDEHATGAAHAEHLRAMEYESMVIVPVISMLYGVTGALALATTRGGKPPLNSDDALLFAVDLGRRCGTAIGKARVHQEALDVSRRFQEAALPRRMPEVGGVRFSALYEPAAQTLVIGGDWYDVFLLRDGRIGISVGDVSGHGLDAAVLMASMKNSLHTALVMDPDLNHALDAADYVFRAEAQNDFCTAMLGILDVRAMTLTCAAAGHPGPQLWTPSTNAVSDPFPKRGLPLGLRWLTADNAVAQTVPLESGMTVAFYTDGLTENGRNLIHGEAALCAALMRPEVRNARDPARAIRDAVAPGPADDDVAVLVLQL